MNRRVITAIFFSIWSLLTCVAGFAQDTYTSGAKGTDKAEGTLTVGPLILTVTTTRTGRLGPPTSVDAASTTLKLLTSADTTGDRKYSLVPTQGGAQVKVKSANPTIPVQLPNTLVKHLTELSSSFDLTSYFKEPVYSFDLSLDPKRNPDLDPQKPKFTVTVFRVDGTSTVLTQPEYTGSSSRTSWHLDGDETQESPIAWLEVEGTPDADTKSGEDLKSASAGKPSKSGTQDSPKECVSAFNGAVNVPQLFRDTCQALYVLMKNDKKDALILGMDVRGGKSSPVLSLTDQFWTEFGSDYSNFSVNGDSNISLRKQKSFQPALDKSWTIEWHHADHDICRALPANEYGYATLVMKLRPPVRKELLNGIVVSPAKVFDVASLQRMLNTTASQLASLSGFSSSSINSAFGNLQGITRDTSYVNAQVTTAATPSISQSNSVGVTTPNTTQTTTPSGPTIVTLQCPDGSLPTIGSSTTLGGCAVPSTGTTPASGTGTLTTTPAGSTTTNTGSTTATQNGTTTTTPSVSGVVPTALASNTLAAPSNVGVASADILAEQVQLNSQITTLQLLLEGALSDQYLQKNSKAVAQRQQTTLGFSVALDPPRQFKHAVAEIRVIIIPKGGSDGLSVMNLLPSEKTYNVAKVTSNQKAFGGGAVIEPVSFGVAAGKSKDRLYLAKDTDTLALEFPLPLLPTHKDSVGRTVPLWVQDTAKSAIEFQRIGGCNWGLEYKEIKNKMQHDVEQAALSGSQPIAFGWQFRPVLGESYVQGGLRQVFAQIALGTGVGQSYVPDVYIQTVWREYNPDKQVVGAEYGGTCSLIEQSGGVSVLNQPVPRDVTVTDLGSGQLKLNATGNFFTSSLSVLSGQTTLPSVFFDGKSIELFGSALNLLEAGDLRIIGEGGLNAPFAISTNSVKKKQFVCGISKASLHAVPRPDGNSIVDLELNLGRDYQPHGDDGEPNPLILIGGQVYGLRESPFINNPATRCGSAPATCKYSFLAPTISLRNAQTFLVRDLAWDNLQATGHTEFLPSFTSVTMLSKPAADSSSDGGAGGPNATVPGKASNPVTDDATHYEISGYDLSKIAKPCDSSFQPSIDKPCLKVYVDANPTALTSKQFEVVSDTLATASLGSSLSGGKMLRFQIFSGSFRADKSADPATTVEWDLALPKAEVPAIASVVGSPSILNVGDSLTVTFKSAAFANFKTPPTGTVNLAFDSGTLTLVGKYDVKKTTITVLIPTAISKVPGHKELSVTVPGKDGGPSSPVALTFEVVK